MRLVFAGRFGRCEVKPLPRDGGAPSDGIAFWAYDETPDGGRGYCGAPAWLTFSAATSDYGGAIYVACFQPTATQ